MKASSKQTEAIGGLLYNGGCGFSTAGKYAKQAEELTVDQAYKVIKYLQKNGIIKDSADDEMLNDILKLVDDKCLLCKVERLKCTC